jgi:hypothetical protein
MWQIYQCLIVRLIRRGLTPFILYRIDLERAVQYIAVAQKSTLLDLVMTWMQTGHNRQDDSTSDRLPTFTLSLESELLHAGAETGQVGCSHVPAVPPKISSRVDGVV